MLESTYRLEIRKALRRVNLLPGDVLYIRQGDPINTPRPVPKGQEPAQLMLSLFWGLSFGYVTSNDDEAAVVALCYMGADAMRAAEAKRNAPPVTPTTWAEVDAALNDTATPPAEPACDTLAWQPPAPDVDDDNDAPWRGSK